MFAWRCLSLSNRYANFLCLFRSLALSFVALLSVALSFFTLPAVILCSLLAAVAPWVALVGRVQILQKRIATPSCPLALNKENFAVVASRSMTHNT